MARRIRIAALIAGFVGAVTQATTALGVDPSQVLVEYGFDHEVPTGPDSLRVIQNARGHVRLTEDFRFSGYSSVELRDVPGDRDFPELQGFFPKIETGRVFLQLALMTPDPGQELNVALAGPGGFGLVDHGIAFWLSTREGTLFHTSDSIPKRLFEVQPFVWYLITADYDVDAGRYDLWAQREGDGEPFLMLEDQPNASSRRGSAVHLFSLIGDNGDDLSSVVYYVDDVLVVRDRPVELPPMIAPGRRRFFADLFAERPADLLRRCPPPRSFDELGVGPAGEADAASALAGWQAGCEALAGGRFAEALRVFAAGLAASPESTALRFALGQTLVALGRDDAVAEVLAGLGDHRDDPRYARLAAMAAARGGDFAAALAWLDDPPTQSPAAEIAETRYFVLRAAGLERRAYELALRQPPSPTWSLRAGSSAFALGDLEAARQAFLAAGDSRAAKLALADVAWLEGDLETERRLREAIYGQLTWR